MIKQDASLQAVALCFSLHFTEMFRVAVETQSVKRCMWVNASVLNLLTIRIYNSQQQIQGLLAQSTMLPGRLSTLLMANWARIFYTASAAVPHRNTWLGQDIMAA